VLQGGEVVAGQELKHGLIVAVLATAAAMAAASDTTAAGATADVPNHPALLAPLSPASTFPRFTAAELEAAGYPDHLHAFTYPGYAPLTDAAGETYGPLSLASGTRVLERAGLVCAPGEIRYRGLSLRFNPGYEAHQMLPMVELLDWARRDLAVLLGHDRGDTLRVESPDDLEAYGLRTGYGFHRLYRMLEDSVVIEPAPILMARGLAAHAAHHLVAVWLLQDLAAGATLPAWLVQGLASYLAEDGTHFLNYLFMHRADRPVILAPGEAETILASPPEADLATDVVRYRTAGYSAFLMVWELVENRGGLAAVREMFTRAGRGEDPDAVCRELYGAELAALAASLDPTGRPEPVGAAVHSRSPQRPPRR